MNSISEIENPAVQRFKKNASTYHSHAEIQPKVAQGLQASLAPWMDILPPGPILEFGCGTGFLSRLLLPMFPKRDFVITDASPEMLQHCKRNLDSEGLLRDNIEFQVLEVGKDKIPEETYAMVTGNFVAQWFNDAAIGLEQLVNGLKSGGLLLTSFPGEQSFPQWYENCLELGLPHTAHPLPNIEKISVALSLGPQQIDYYENDLYQEFDSALSFFQHLKKTGSAYSKPEKHLSPKQFRMLLRHWDSKSHAGKIRVKWHIAYLAAKRD